MSLKQLETYSKTIGENTFYIRPLPAFKAANLSGELAALAMPLLSGIAPLVSSDKNITDLNTDEVAPALSGAFSSLSGDKLEKLLRKLLIESQNVSVSTPDDDKAEILTEDIVNEVFCSEVQDMYVLAFEVIKINYNGFFNRLSVLSGPLTDKLEKMTEGLKNTGSSTLKPQVYQNSN